MTTERTSCHATVLLLTQPHDGESGNASRPNRSATRASWGFTLGGAMCEKDIVEVGGCSLIRPGIAWNPKAEKKSRLISISVWVAIGTIIVLTLMGV